jgi:NAD(P)H-hydrate epimerase
LIPLLTREAVRAIDRHAVETLGLPSLALMENAGAGAASALLARFGDRLAHVCVIGGTGQNGGDAWVVARHLLEHGTTPRCVLVGAEAEVCGDAQRNLAVLRVLGVRVACVARADASGALDAALDGATLIVDGLFGTGLSRPLDGIAAHVVERINDAGVPVVALDLPSGIDADTGAVLGTAVRAALTTTFAAHKRGLHQHPGVAHAGEVVLVSIGVPVSPGAPAQLVDRADVAALVAPRGDDAHKGTAGHVLVFAGSPGHTGAAVLAGLGALRGGAGLVTLAPRAEARPAIDAKLLELMSAALPAELDDAARVALTLCEGKRTALLGPGFGHGDGLARTLALTLPIPCVLDADALTALGDDLTALRRAAAPRVLTPHPGEAARLLGTSVATVQADRFAAALRLTAQSGHIVVLKGARTIIASPDGALRVCAEGTPALGVAGTGDVLAGAIAAQLAPQDGPARLDAVTAAVVLHALAGTLAARADRGLLAHEVADALPDALTACRAVSRTQTR